MGYLSPFTDGIIQFIYSWLRLPTVLYLMISLAVTMLGLTLYLTSTDFDLKDILNLLPRTIVSVQKRLDKRRLGAIFLISIGLLGLFTFADRLNVEAATLAGGGGGPAVYKCGQYACWSQGNSGLICDSGTTSPPSPCWTQVQHGFLSCNISLGGSTCIGTATFSPAYSIIPNAWEAFNGTPPSPTHTYTLISPAPVSKILIFQAVNSTIWKNVPTTDTELYGLPDQRLEWTTPTGFASQKAQFCVSVSDMLTAVIPQFIAQTATSLAGPWTNLGDASFYALPAGNGFVCGSLETITLTASQLYYFRVAGSDPAGPVNIALGTVELFISGTGSASLMQALTDACFLSVFSISTTQVRVRAACSASVDALTSFNFNWWSGIAA